jgi:hypothetical protein
MPEIAEIKSKIAKFQNDTAFLALRSRWETDFDLFSLEPYDAGRNYISYTSNSPKNLANKALGMLNEAKLIIRVPEEVLTDEDKETANNIERFLYGVVNINDDFNELFPDTPTLRGMLSWYAALRGSVVVRPYVRKMDDGSTLPEIAVWDPYNVAYGIGKNGLKWAAHTRRATREEVADEFGPDFATTDTVEIIDYWDEKDNAIVVGNRFAKQLTKHGAARCPVYYIKCGATPVVVQRKRPNASVQSGDSIYGPNRHIYPVKNKTISDYLTIVRRGVKPPMGFWSAGGDKNLDEDIWQVEHGFVQPLQHDDKLAPLIEPTMPVDAQAIYNIIEGEVQLGGIPNVAQGQLGFRLSGFAITQLQGSLATVITPFVDCIERAYKASFRELLSQYTKGNWRPISVRGRNSKNQPFGMPKAIDIQPEDLAGDWRPEVSLRPVFPKDDAQRYQIARLATDGENPLTSVRYALSEIVELDDVQLEEATKSEEWASRLPLIRLWRAFKKSVESGDMDEAFNIVTQLQLLIQQGGGNVSPNQQAAMGSMLQNISTENPGMGAPTGDTGVSTSTMPPEMLGGPPGGVVNAQGL